MRSVAWEYVLSQVCRNGVLSLPIISLTGSEGQLETRDRTAYMVYAEKRHPTKEPAMTLTLELPQELETALKAQALANGMTLEAWLQKIAAERVQAKVPRPRSLQDELTPEEWVSQFDAWVDGHDRTTPLLSDEAISRESIYPDRI